MRTVTFELTTEPAALARPRARPARAKLAAHVLSCFLYCPAVQARRAWYRDVACAQL